MTSVLILILAMLIVIAVQLDSILRRETSMATWKKIVIAFAVAVCAMLSFMAHLDLTYRI